MDTDKPNAACAASVDFGLRREAKRHAAFGCNRPYGKRCRRCAPVFAALRLGRLPPQSKSLSSVRELLLLYYGWQGAPLRAHRELINRPFPLISADWRRLAALNIELTLAELKEISAAVTPGTSHAGRQPLNIKKSILQKNTKEKKRKNIFSSSFTSFASVGFLIWPPPGGGCSIRPFIDELVQFTLEKTDCDADGCAGRAACAG